MQYQCGLSCNIIYFLGVTYKASQCEQWWVTKQKGLFPFTKPAANGYHGAHKADFYQIWNIYPKKFLKALKRGEFTKVFDHTNGLVQDCSNSIANAQELLQSCTKPLIQSVIMGSLLSVMPHICSNIHRSALIMILKDNTIIRFL